VNLFIIVEFNDGCENLAEQVKQFFHSPLDRGLLVNFFLFLEGVLALIFVPIQ
jgi:hypothetical protein